MSFWNGNIFHTKNDEFQYHENDNTIGSFSILYIKRLQLQVFIFCNAYLNIFYWVHNFYVMFSNIASTTLEMHSDETMELSAKYTVDIFSDKNFPSIEGIAQDEVCLRSVLVPENTKKEKQWKTRILLTPKNRKTIRLITYEYHWYLFEFFRMAILE